MGYHFWDDQNRKVIRSKDVTFNENAMCKDKFDGNTETKKKSQ